MIRPERPGDEDAIRAVETAAFGRELEAKIVDDLRGSPAFIPDLSLVAEKDGKVVGHVLISRGSVDPSGAPILLLGPIGVDPERQGQGIGRALVEAALEGARRLGAPCVALIGDPALYERFGFVHAEPLGVLPPAGWPSRPFQVARL
ncbi:MAG: GNAT family N-acetyltransferase, partial [Gaiellaceae bacterium]